MNVADYFTLVLLLIGALASFLTLHAMATGFFIARIRENHVTFERNILAFEGNEGF